MINKNLKLFILIVLCNNFILHYLNFQKNNMSDERIAVSDLKSELGDLIKNTLDIFTTSSDEGIFFIYLIHLLKR